MQITQQIADWLEDNWDRLEIGQCECGKEVSTDDPEAVWCECCIELFCCDKCRQAHKR